MNIYVPFYEFFLISIQLARRILKLLHTLFIVPDETNDALTYLTKPLYRMYIIMLYEMYILRDYFEDFQDLRGECVYNSRKYHLHYL